VDRNRQSVAHEAARIIVEGGLTDYRAAKNKAAQRLGLEHRGAMPDNAEVQQALIEYQQLFGGEEYAARLRRMRGTAVRALKLLAGFGARLVGGTVSGAITEVHRVQLHAFSDKPESVEIFLGDLGVAVEQDDRNYRFADGREERIAVAGFEIEGVGVDVAVFGEEDRRVPINPADGAPYKRLDLAQAEALAKS
jgi:hypothetical protein